MCTLRSFRLRATVVVRDAGLRCFRVRARDGCVSTLDANPRPACSLPREYGGTRFNGNSIFVFESAGICIAHLGHLHHTLNQQQLNEIGRVDAVFVPVDGSMTLDDDGMMEVLEAMKAPLMIPMHFFSVYTLHRFLDRARERKWEVESSPVPSTVISKTTLPATPKVLVLPGR